MNLDLEAAKVLYYPDFITKEDADQYFATFAKLPFERRTVIYNNQSKGKLNRGTLAFGDDGVSLPDIWGKDLQLMPWTPDMQQIKEQIEKITNTTYNICLCNYYSTAKRTIGWHADREELGDTQCIASVSFGDERPFLFRKQGEKEKCHEIILENGSLLWMGPGTQENYEHCVPIVKNAQNFKGRINLTFRKFHPENYSKNYLTKE